MCIITDPNDNQIATIPYLEGLYCLAAARGNGKFANLTSMKMMLFKAHCKLGHISYQAVRHTVLKGLIEGIQVDLNSDEEFCEACTRTNSARQPYSPYPQEFKTRASTY